jgi:hypothetical protein
VVVTEAIVVGATRPGVVADGPGVTLAAEAIPTPMARVPITQPVARQADEIHFGPRLMCPLRIERVDWSG